MKRIQSTIAAILIVSQIALPIPTPIPDIAPAEAVLYSPNTKIPRTGEFALRKAIPANPNMKSIQVSDFSNYLQNCDSLLNERVLEKTMDAMKLHKRPIFFIRKEHWCIVA